MLSLGVGDSGNSCGYVCEGLMVSLGFVQLHTQTGALTEVE